MCVTLLKYLWTSASIFSSEMLITPMSLFWLWCVVISLCQLGAKTSYLVVQAGLDGGYYQICGNYTAKADIFLKCLIS